MDTVRLVYFSPTGTSKAVARAIGAGFGAQNVRETDLTRPEVREAELVAAPGELLVVAVPVYAGRVPALLRGCLANVRANGAPCVCVVVYGNRDFEDALLELRDLLASGGARVVASAAFIGEHSFSTTNIPIAVARPDEDDLRLAEGFGAALRELLGDAASPADLPEHTPPGNRPYKEPVPREAGVFIEVGEECIRCGECEELCPVSAIDLEHGVERDKDRCIRCCACIKGCPQGARSMVGPIVDVARWLNANCSGRREPQTWL